MKKILGVLVLLICSYHADAQMKMGVRLAISDVSTNPYFDQYIDLQNARLYELDYMSSNNCSSLGIAFYQDKERVFFLYEALYRKCVYNYKLTTKHNFETVRSRYEDSQSVFTLQMAAGIKWDHFKIGGGPFINLGLDSERSFSGMEGFESREKSMTPGFQVLIGVMLNKHIHLDLKREFQFSSVGENYLFLGDELGINTSPHMTTLSLGIFL